MSLNGILQDLGVVGGSGGSDTTKPTTLSIVAGSTVTSGKVYKLSQDFKVVSYDTDLYKNYCNVYLNTLTGGSLVTLTSTSIFPLYNDERRFIICGYAGYILYFRVIEISTSGVVTVLSEHSITNSSTVISTVRFVPMNYCDATYAYYGYAVAYGNFTHTNTSLYLGAVRVAYSNYALSTAWTTAQFSNTNPTWAAAGTYYDHGVIRGLANGFGGCTFNIYFYTRYYDGAGNWSSQSYTSYTYRLHSSSYSSQGYLGQATSYASSDYPVPTGITTHPLTHSLCRSPGGNNNTLFLVGHSNGSMGLFYSDNALSVAPNLISSSVTPTSGYSSAMLYKFGDALTAAHVYYLVVWMEPSTSILKGRVVKLNATGTALVTLGDVQTLLANHYPNTGLPYNQTYRHSSATDTTIIIPVIKSTAPTIYSMLKIIRPAEMTLQATALYASITSDTNTTVSPYNYGLTVDKVYAVNYIESASSKVVYGIVTKDSTNTTIDLDTVVLPSNVKVVAKSSAALDASVTCEVVEKNKEYATSGKVPGLRYAVNSVGDFVADTSGTFIAISSTKLVALS